MRSWVSQFSKSFVFLAMALQLMGASSCQPSATPQRTLLRRVQLGQITAPNITLPSSLGSQQFNFGFVANQQMAALLGSTGTFSTANESATANYTPATLASMINDDFQNCTEFGTSPIAPIIVPTATAEPTDPGTVVIQGGGIITSNNNSCTPNLPQAVINGSILDFTLLGGGGVSLSLAGVSALPNIDFTFQAYSLQLQMTAEKPLDVGNNNFLAVLTNSNGYGGTLSGTMNFGTLQLGANGYYQTPLSTIVQSGLTSALSDLASQWTSEDVWYASVLKACGTYIYINGSNDLGLEVGDLVAIKNVTYMWNGPVCDAESLGDVPDVSPVGYAQIVSLGDDISVAQVLKGNQTYPHANTTIYAGARVYMYQTAEQVKALQQARSPSPDVCSLPVSACTTSATASAGTANSSQ